MALITPLALAWGMAELAAKGLVARFAARLCLAGLFVVASVILATDVLSSRPFSQAWPTARMHFEYLPLGLLALIAVVSVLTAVVALATVGLRTRQDAGWRRALPAVASAGVAVLAVQGLQASLPDNAAYPGLSVVIVVLAALAGERASRLPLAALRAPRGRADDHGWPPPGQPGNAADDPPGRYADGYRRYDDTGGFGGDRYGTGGHAGYPGGGYDDTGGFGPATGDFQPGEAAGYGPDQYPHTGQFSSYPAGEFGGPHGGAAPEPVTGAFDALYRENAAAARGPGPAAGPAAADGPGSGVEPVTGMQLAALEEAVLERAAQAGPAPEPPLAAAPRTRPWTPNGSMARSPSTRCWKRGRRNSTGWPVACSTRSPRESRTRWCTWCTGCRPRRCSASSTRSTGTGPRMTSTCGSPTWPTSTPGCGRWCWPPT